MGEVEVRGEGEGQEKKEPRRGWGEESGGGGKCRLIDVVVYCGRCRVSRDSLEHN